MGDVSGVAVGVVEQGDEGGGHPVNLRRFRVTRHDGLLASDAKNPAWIYKQGTP